MHTATTQESPYPPQRVPAVIPYAGFWQRFCAALIDNLVLLPTLIAIPLFLLGRPLYFALCESSSHQGTVGKRLMGIKVVSIDGYKLTTGQAFGRYFSKILSTCFCCFGYFMAAFTVRKQALHDIIIGSLVVEK